MLVAFEVFFSVFSSNFDDISANGQTMLLGVSMHPLLGVCLCFRLRLKFCLRLEIPIRMDFCLETIHLYKPVHKNGIS